MIASNFIRFPAALLAQRELELVIAAPEALTKEASALVRKSIAATVAWACEFVTKRAGRKVPAWFAATRRRAMKLAAAIRAACISLGF